MTVGIGVGVPKSLLQASSLVGILAGHVVGSTTFTPSSVPSQLPNLPTLPSATYCTQYLANGKQLLVTKTAATCPILSASTTTSASTEVATYNPGGAWSLGDVDPSDNECTAFREQVVVYGEVTWKPVEESVRENECDQYCHAKWDDAVAHGKVASAGCMLDDQIAWTEFNSTWQTAKGKCLCNVPVINTIIEDFVKSLPAVAEITCKVWYTAISSVLEVGLNALPGVGQAVGAALTLAYQAAQVAAYTYENKQDAANAFTTWAQNPSSQHMASGSSTWGMDKLCGNKYTPPQAEKIFGDFSLASGSIGIPKLWAGALRAWPPPYPKGSGSLDEMLGYIDGLGGKPRPRGGKPGHDNPGHGPHKTNVPKSHPPTSDRPKSEHRTSAPKSTEPHKSSRASSEKSCTRHGKRMQGNKKDDCKPTTITKILASHLLKDENVETKTCSWREYSQACAHYYSAIHANPRKLGKSRFTCEDNNTRDNQRYTSHWYEHHNEVWQRFTPPRYRFDGKEMKNEEKLLTCEADEWPPAYFVPKKAAETGDVDWGQRIRWIPKEENGGVAQLWKAFCVKYDGGEYNGQRAGTIGRNSDGDITQNLREYEAYSINERLVPKLGKMRQEVGREDKTTTEIYENVQFSRGVFEIAFDWTDGEKPAAKNEWHLEENPCWPKMVAPNDPGFCLLTDDPWYKQHPKLDAGLYELPPAWELFKQANQARKKKGWGPVDDKGMPEEKGNGDKRKPSPQPDPNPAKAPKKGDGSGKGKGKGSSSGSGKGKGKSTSGSRRRRLELIDDRIHVRDDLYNTTRPLTDEELRHSVEITYCDDRRCSREQEEVAANDDDDLIIPGVGPPSKPSANAAVPTPVTETETAPPRFAGRSLVSPDLPVVTAANGMQD